MRTGIRETTRPEAPWYVVPADNKWFTRLVVAAALVEALDRLKLEYPKVGGKMLKELRRPRRRWSGAAAERERLRGAERPLVVYGAVMATLARCACYPLSCAAESARIDAPRSFRRALRFPPRMNR